MEKYAPRRKNEGHHNRMAFTYLNRFVFNMWNHKVSEISGVAITLLSDGEDFPSLIKATQNAPIAIATPATIMQETV